VKVCHLETMNSRRKLLVVLLLLVCFSCSVQPRPTDDEGDAAEVTDEDATIQHNPNYTKPEKIDVGDGEDLVEEGLEVDAEKEKQVAEIIAAKEAKKEKKRLALKAAMDAKKEEEVVETVISVVEKETKDTAAKAIVTDSEDLAAPEDDEEVDCGYLEGDSDDEYDEDEYDEEDEKKESQDAVRRVLAQALSKSRTVPRYAIKFAKKNRVKLTIAAVLFAFRKEIGRIAYLILTKPKTIDPETGKVLSRTINISPTSALKILLFLDLMRKLNSGEVTEASPLGSKGSLLLKLLHPANTAFIPPIEQHWTFERVNERYEKDEMAFQKAMSASGAVFAGSKKPMGQSLRSFASSSILGNTIQDKEEDLVILLDWTKLSESVDQMSSLRDQVSFLLSQHRAKNRMLSTATVSDTTNINATQQTTEIVVMLESPGGAAADYGLAAQMMLRLSHEPGLVVTVCVDKVAASGGYMIACASSPGRLFGTY